MTDKPIVKAILALVTAVVLFNVSASWAARSDANDRAISSRVEEKIMNDSRLKDSRINVETIGREVTLKGAVGSQSDVTRAGELARSVEGVRNVDNKLKVEKGSSGSIPQASRPPCPIGANWC